MSDKFGKIAQVIGPVVDVAFEGAGNELPPIYTEMLEYTDILSNLFRIAPLNYGEEYLELVYRHVLHRAYYIRYFEGSHILKFFLRIYQKLRRLKK